MARVAVPTAKASVFDTPEGLVINIPSAKRWAVTIFMAFWLCGWAFGEFEVIHLFSIGKIPLSASLFTLVWLAMWTMGGCLTILVWLWNVAGREIVSLTPASLAIRRDILGFGSSKEYDLPSVRNLRIELTPEKPENRISVWGAPMFGGAIAFDYGAKTFRFGAGVDEAEASHLIELLKSRYPFDPPPR
jgi:hypothetical protein